MSSLWISTSRPLDAHRAVQRRATAEPRGKAEAPREKAEEKHGTAEEQHGKAEESHRNHTGGQCSPDGPAAVRLVDGVQVVGRAVGRALGPVLEKAAQPKR